MINFYKKSITQSPLNHPEVQQRKQAWLHGVDLTAWLWPITSASTRRSSALTWTTSGSSPSDWDQQLWALLLFLGNFWALGWPGKTPTTACRCYCWFHPCLSCFVSRFHIVYHTLWRKIGTTSKQSEGWIFRGKPFSICMQTDDKNGNRYWLLTNDFTNISKMKQYLMSSQ